MDTSFQVLATSVGQWSVTAMHDVCSTTTSDDRCASVSMAMEGAELSATLLVS